jgi:hypothetical protein
MQFEDLVWQPHPERPDLGERAEHVFDNGWRVTFLNGNFSIFTRKGSIYEAQPWKPDGSLPTDGKFTAWPYHGDAGLMQILMDAVEAENQVWAAVVKAIEEYHYNYDPHRERLGSGDAVEIANEVERLLKEQPCSGAT